MHKAGDFNTLYCLCYSSSKRLHLCCAFAILLTCEFFFRIVLSMQFSLGRFQTQLLVRFLKHQGKIKEGKTEKRKKKRKKRKKGKKKKKKKRRKKKKKFVGLAASPRSVVFVRFVLFGWCRRW